MINFQPHRIQRSSLSEGVTDTNGDYTEGTRTWGDIEACLAEPSGAANVIVVGGEQVTYKYTIYLKTTSANFSYGDVVRLYQGDVLLGEFKVLGFHRYQLSCKLWV